MRVNTFYFSDKFQSFLNTFSFIMFIICMLLTILLPLPYKNELPGGISLQPDPNLAPPIIALCVLIPFLLGMNFFLIFKVTYKKSVNEVKKEFQENVTFNLIDTQTVHKWENELTDFGLSKELRKVEAEKRQQEQFINLQKKKAKLQKEMEEIAKQLRQTQEEHQQEQISKGGKS